MRRVFWFTTLLLLTTMFGSFAVGSVSAQAPATFTLQPGGNATVTYEAFCTDFGKKFPLAIQSPNGVAPDAVRAALANIQSNGLASDPQKALEAQYAIWQLSGATGSPSGSDVAKSVVDAAKTVPQNPGGTSVVDAAKANQVKVTLNDWKPVGDKVPIGNSSDNFYGRGTLTIENTSQQALTLYMPVGTLFPPQTAGEQTMAGYATNVQVTNPAPAATAVPATDPASRPNTLPATSGGETNTLVLFAAFLLLAAGVGVGMVRRKL